MLEVGCKCSYSRRVPGRFGRCSAFCCWHADCRSQKGKIFKYLSQQSWSTEEGLPQSSVHSIVQTPDGYLWLATEGGLVRFDGFTFQTFDRSNQPALTSDDVCCLATERNGLWIGTADGVLRLQQGQFHRYGASDGLASAAVESIHVTREGGLFVETAGGWSQWNQSSFRAVQNPPDGLRTEGPGLVAVRGKFVVEVLRCAVFGSGSSVAGRKRVAGGSHPDGDGGSRGAGLGGDEQRAACSKRG